MSEPAAAPFTRADARNLGFGDSQIDHLLRSGRWRSAHRGVLVSATTDLGRLASANAAVKTQPPGRAWVALTSAAHIWNLDVDSGDNVIHLYVPRDAQTIHRPGVRLHHTHLADTDQAVLHGVPVTSAARTVIDLARILPFFTAVVIADSALRRGVCTKAELVETLARLAGLREVRAARRAVAESDPDSDSAPETILRLTLVAGGLPRPEPNFVLLDDTGYPIARGDLVYELLLLWLEYDGFLVHTTRAAFRNDRLRRRMLERRGWQVKQFSDVDLRSQRNLVREVGELIDAAPARIAALPAGLSPEVDRAQRALHRVR